MIYEKKSENDIYEVEAKEVASIHGQGETKRRICKGMKWRVSSSEDRNEGMNIVVRERKTFQPYNT
jgi:hypothetical protein